METVKINTEFIKLDQFLKWINEVESGSNAKMMISEGRVIVNDEKEFRRGKKLRAGDRVKVNNKIFLVESEEVK